MATPLIAVMIHMFNYSLVQEFKNYLLNITRAGYAYDLYVAVKAGTDYSEAKQAWPKATFLERENRGFDIGSFLASLDLILPKPYEYILKLHSKNDPKWRRALIDPLLSTPARVQYTMQLFQDPTVGMQGCRKWMIHSNADFGVNKTHMTRISQEWKVPLKECHFIGGTIFWIRTSLLRKYVKTIDLNHIADNLNTIETLDWSWYLMTYPELRKQGIDSEASALSHWQDIGKTQGRACNCLYARINRIPYAHCDGMLEHGYERFFGMLVSHSGLRLAGIGSRNLLVEHQLQFLAKYHLKIDWDLVKSQGGQPHPNFGFSLPNDPESWKQQVELMQAHGITGVCFQVNPETVEILQNLPIEIPFCLSYSEGEPITPSQLSLLGQHPNCIKIGNRPLVIVGSATMKEVSTFPINPSEVRSFSRDLHQRLLDELANSARGKPGQKYIIFDSWNDWHNDKVLMPSRNQDHQILQELKNTLKYFN